MQKLALGLLYLPASQGRHDEKLDLLWYVPAPQSRHTRTLDSFLPGGHDRQLADPVTFVTQPEGQASHDVGRTLTLVPLPPPATSSLYSMNVPAAHAKHSDASPKAHLPGAHSVQTAASSADDFPLMHAWQPVIGGNVVTPLSSANDL